MLAAAGTMRRAVGVSLLRRPLGSSQGSQYGVRKVAAMDLGS